ncbi:ATP-binding protein [Mucilaginibacter sp. RS28]|uniref:ATP-binding protein n=1 Tax=Mucilaginibacter straminoryzae TaxID=2932774 RepID=A0A9X1X313_9SPHI|nr:ATP-binding protein [Mucilaginibacter straminoryzae]MCJ8209706.1 ATP-binding protein [Mucilaginibacter straminoryzae]
MLRFTPDSFNRLFPFFLLLKNDLSIAEAGESYSQLIPNLKYSAFLSQFEIWRPTTFRVSFKALRTADNQFFVLRSLTRKSFLLRGQFEYLEPTDEVIFAGSPWMKSVDQMNELGLNLKNFAKHDSVIDLLMVLKRMEVENETLTELLVTVEQQKDKLKEGETRILNALKKEKEFNDLKSNFISLTSHEFRTPLTTIRSSAELTELSLGETSKHPKISKYLGHIKEEVDYIDSLLTDIYTASKIQSDSFELRLEQLSIVSLLNEITSSEYITAGKYTAVETFGEERSIVADIELIKMAFSRIINNSYKFSEGCLPPRVHITFMDDEVKIDFQDFGIGIPREDFQNLFSPFGRGKNAATLRGAGMGLFIAQKFIELHGGFITVTSDLKQGSIFSVTLPITPDTV